MGNQLNCCERSGDTRLFECESTQPPIVLKRPEKVKKLLNNMKLDIESETSHGRENLSNYLNQGILYSHNGALSPKTSYMYNHNSSSNFFNEGTLLDQDQIETNNVTQERKISSQYGETYKKTPRFIGASLTSKDDSDNEEDEHFAFDQFSQNGSLREIAAGSSVVREVNVSDEDSFKNIFSYKQQKQADKVSVPKIDLNYSVPKIDLQRIKCTAKTIQINQNKLKTFKFKNGFKPGKANKITHKKSEKSSKYSSIISGERNSQGIKVIDDFSEESSHEIDFVSNRTENDDREDMSQQTFADKTNQVQLYDRKSLKKKMSLQSLHIDNFGSEMIMDEKETYTPRALEQLEQLNQVINPALVSSQVDLTISSQSVKVIQINDEQSSEEESDGSVRVIQVNDNSDSGFNSIYRSSMSGPMQVIDESEDSTPDKSTPSQSKILQEFNDSPDQMVTIEEDVRKENMVSPISTPQSKQNGQKIRFE